MKIRAKAPLRISFGGGGTDVPPYPEEKGGAVINSTINKYIYTTLVPRQDKKIIIHAIDYQTILKYDISNIIYDGNFDLIKAVFDYFKVDSGADIFVSSEAPPGSGLGSSSTLVVSLIGLVREWLNIPMTDYEIAETAYDIERIKMGIPGGKQDQYSATFGGFNFMEFFKDYTIVNPLKIKRYIINELEMNLILCYTGRIRKNVKIIEEQIKRYKEGLNVEYLDQTKKIAYEMKKSILTGDLDYFGKLLHEAWICKKNFSPHISLPEIDKMYESAIMAGAFGGKLLGAGGGGYLLIYAPFEIRRKVMKALVDSGGEIVPFNFEFKGLQTWVIK